MIFFLTVSGFESLTALLSAKSGHADHRAPAGRLLCIVLTAWVCFSVIAFSDTIVPKLIRAPGLKTEYIDANDDGCTLLLTAYSYPKQNNVRIAVWSNDDQSDIVWYTAENLPGADKIWISPVVIEEFSPARVYNVHIYCSDAKDADIFLGAYHLSGAVSSTPY